MRALPPGRWRCCRVKTAFLTVPVLRDLSMSLPSECQDLNFVSQTRSECLCFFGEHAYSALFDIEMDRFREHGLMCSCFYGEHADTGCVLALSSTRNGLISQTRLMCLCFYGVHADTPDVSWRCPSQEMDRFRKHGLMCLCFYEDCADTPDVSWCCSTQRVQKRARRIDFGVDAHQGRCPSQR